MTSPSDATVEAVAKALAAVEGDAEWDQRPESRSDTFADFTPREEFRDMARAAISAHLDALKAEGMVVVPREPTHEMTIAGSCHGWIGQERANRAYSAMISAAEGK